MLRLVGASALACALACSPHTAHAQTQQERDRTARAEFTAGREAFSHGDFRDAAARFEHAYQLSQRRELLYNIGTAYERLHRWAPARDAFREYLESFPNAPERDELNGRLTTIEAEIRREEDRARAASAVSTSPGPSANPIVRERVVVREVPVDTHPMRTAGIVLGGLGLISGVASLSIGLLTNSYYDQLLHSCGQTADGCLPAVIQDVQLRATLTNVFAIGGGVLAAGAVAMIVIDMTRGHASSATRARGPATWNLGFAPARDGGGFVLSGAF